MPFHFTYICDLLHTLETLTTTRSAFLPPPTLLREQRDAISRWFLRHRAELDHANTDLTAVLSCLLPERRPDRVYALQEARLVRILPRALCLNAKRTASLREWRTPGRGDLGACVQRVLEEADAEPRPGARVQAEEVEAALQLLGSKMAFSAPEVRRLAERRGSEGREVVVPEDLLGELYLRCRAREAKWLTRMILKNLSPVVLDASFLLAQAHFLLPDLLRFQDSLPCAVATLRGAMAMYHARPDAKSQALFRRQAVMQLRPTLGVKVGRPEFRKAWSLENVMGMARGKRWMVETKYDGEYCEIHVDMSKFGGELRIFSKSGKDSTQDRAGVHDAIRAALRMGQPDCPIKHRCIVLGELLVYSDSQKKVLDFRHIRKHVFRSRRLIGTDADSFPQAGEHLMMMFFDVLLLDDEITMTLPMWQRRKTLNTLVTKREGHAETSQWKTIDFGQSSAAQNLAFIFVNSLAKRAEGLVLKPADSPYFCFASGIGDSIGYFIKVKKDYMADLDGHWDEADFAVIGASFDPKVASRSDVRGLKWTAFYLGCVTNTEEVRFGAKPTFEIVACIDHTSCFSKQDMKDLNGWGQFCIADPNEEPPFTLRTTTAFPKPLTIFNEPFVVEVLGSGYERPSNASFLMLRHPRIRRLHLDRTWKDAVTFPALQAMAERARDTPSQGETQEMVTLYEAIRSKYNAKRRQKGLSQVSDVHTFGSQTTPSRASERTVSSSAPTSPVAVVQRSGANSKGKGRAVPLVRVDTAERLYEEELFSPPGDEAGHGNDTTHTRRGSRQQQVTAVETRVDAPSPKGEGAMPPPINKPKARQTNSDNDEHVKSLSGNDNTNIEQSIVKTHSRSIITTSKESSSIEAVNSRGPSSVQSPGTQGITAPRVLTERQRRNPQLTRSTLPSRKVRVAQTKVPTMATPLAPTTSSNIPPHQQRCTAQMTHSHSAENIDPLGIEPSTGSPLERRGSHKRKRPHAPPSPDDSSQDEASPRDCSFQNTGYCMLKCSPTCILANTAVHIDADLPMAEELIADAKLHGVTHVANIESWMAAEPPRTVVVPDSQPTGGARKIAFADFEGNCTGLRLVELALQGSQRSEIFWFDYRALRSLTELEKHLAAPDDTYTRFLRQEEMARTSVNSHFWFVTGWDEALGRMRRVDASETCSPFGGD